jgi:hypothetical protein
VPVPYGTDAHGVLHPFRRMPILEVGEVIAEMSRLTAWLKAIEDRPSFISTAPG